MERWDTKKKQKETQSLRTKKDCLYCARKKEKIGREEEKVRDKQSNME